MGKIAGISNRSIAILSLEAMVKEMCQPQHSRGEAVYVAAENYIALGHSNQQQLLCYGNNRYHISYNGTLYNYTELKEVLTTTSWLFTGQTDAEIIVAAFATWGTKAFARFNGMFAFALYDNEANELYLVRDSIGIKSLYYAHTAEGLAFASEVKAFKKIPYLQQKNTNAQVFFMAYGFLPEPITTLNKVKPVEKGTWLKYHVLSAGIEMGLFKRYNYFEKIENRREAIALIKSSLQNAVHRQLISKASVGIFTDNAEARLIALLANKTGAGVKKMSVVFTDKNYSGKQYQQRITATDFHYHLHDVMNAMDLPSGNGIAAWFKSKYAKERGVDSMLADIGSNELYGGYTSFEKMRTALLLQKLPNKILKLRTNASSKKIRRMAYLSIEGIVGRYLFFKGQFVPVEIAKYLDANEAEVWRILEESPVTKNIGHLTAGNQASWMEYNIYMQNQLLREADGMAMAHGVEIRLPFLDTGFVDTSLQINSSLKYTGKNRKQLLIDSFKDILPEQDWRSSAINPAIAFKEWLGDDRYIKSSNKKYMGEYLAKMRSGAMHWSQFFTLLVMEK